MNFFKEVYEVVKKIPAGKVMTYGQVAGVVGSRDARRVGQALHANKDLNVPCHRVVFADGSLAPGFAFGGMERQREKLKKEKVMFAGLRVDMLKSRYS